ncbi:conserved membrane hypothetical protein [Hyphomicrobiales bacterium]|nr:conserved membrane hypothetical protein [Hyphomicrobiales bacterium]
MELFGLMAGSRRIASGYLEDDLARMRALLRFIGFILLTGGFVAFVIDGARGIANSQFVPTSLATTLEAALPALFPQFLPWMSAHLPEAAQRLVTGSLLTLPTAAVGAILGILLLWLGRRPADPFLFKPLR